MSKACLFDTTLCIGCRACQVACKAWNELPSEHTKFQRTSEGYENPAALSSKTYTRITFHEILNDNGTLDRSVFVKRQCMHCLDPACVAACPVAALQTIKGDGKGAGAVVYDAEKCMGCRYCMLACPFSVPKFEWDKRVPEIQKCTFCVDRLEEESAQVKVNGESLAGESRDRFDEGQHMPACVKVCPTRAILFGEREDMITEGRRRIKAQKSKPDSWQYVDHIYGEKEVGGTSWMYLANVPFEQLGFRTDLGVRPYPAYTNAALSSVPPAVIGLGAILGGVYWVSQRKTEMENDKTEGATTDDS
jgi:formate dehydrogenase iron-sulfur subunit